MVCYLKKFWKVNFLVILFTIIVSAAEVANTLIHMQAFQGIIELKLLKFVVWETLNLAVWLLKLGFMCIQQRFQCHAIYVMNNEIRRDIALSLLKGNYQKYHDHTNGERLSQLTNDIIQIEKLAWAPFFNCIGYVATITFSVIALVSFHWSLLFAALANAAIMYIVPKLFNKKMGHLGEICSHQQAAGTSHLKDLLAGFDVLRSFGREQRFIQEIEQASDQIEKSKYRLIYSQYRAGIAVAVVNITCQLLITT